MINWTPLEIFDLQLVSAIANQIHPQLPEREDVFREKLKLFPQGCRKLIFKDKIAGYGLSHPWKLYSIPQLDTFLNKLPDYPDCLYIHDVAILPHARKQNASSLFIDNLISLARQSGIRSISLVSVYMTTGFWQKYGFRVTKDIGLNDKLKSYGDTASYMLLQL